MSKALTLGAYCLCYQEGDWLAENIRRLYANIDRFSIVIGPSDRAYGYEQRPDDWSERILRSIPDRDGKISVIVRDAWDHKNEMTAAATAQLDTDIIMQLDADEFWPAATFDAAMNALSSGADRVSAPHLIFWGGPSHVLHHVERGPHYFAPARFFRRVCGAELGHFDGRYHHVDGSIEPVRDVDLSSETPVWHFGWVGEQRVARKLRFYREARKLNMPSETACQSWTDMGRPNLRLDMGHNTVEVTRWRGDMDQSLAAWVRRMSRESR